MILERIEKMDELLIASLANSKTPESSTLEFKAKLPGPGDADKKEFLKDVCAMANAQGGDIAYGVEEKDGAAEKLTPHNRNC